mgnify:CR=1 FL=1
MVLHNIKIYSSLEKILLTTFLACALTTGIMYKTKVKEKYSKVADGITLGLGAGFYISRLTKKYSK